MVHSSPEKWYVQLRYFLFSMLLHQVCEFLLVWSQNLYYIMYCFLFGGTWKWNTNTDFSTLNYAAEGIILGFQHYLVMLGTSVIIPTIIVPQMGGGNVSTSLFLSSLSIPIRDLYTNRKYCKLQVVFFQFYGFFVYNIDMRGP